MGREQTGTVMKPLPIIATVVVIALLVLGGLYYFNNSGRPPIPAVPGELQSKAESAVFLIIAEFEGPDGKRICAQVHIRPKRVERVGAVERKVLGSII